MLDEDFNCMLILMDCVILCFYKFDCSVPAKLNGLILIVAPSSQMINDGQINFIISNTYIYIYIYRILYS